MIKKIFIEENINEEELIQKFNKKNLKKKELTIIHKKNKSKIIKKCLKYKKIKISLKEMLFL